MKKNVLLRQLFSIAMLLLLVSCAKEQIIIAEDAPGYIEMTASWKYDNGSTNKGPVPECSPFMPTRIEYTFNNTIVRSSPITVTDFVVKATDVISLDAGNYTVTDISLYNSDGVVTHTVPEQGDVLSQFVVQPVPFDIQIVSGELYKNQIQVACYTRPIDIDIPAEYDPDITILEFETFYFYIPPGSCVTQVSVQINTYTPEFIDITASGIYTLTIPKTEEPYRANSYIDGVLFQSFFELDYNPDDNIDQDDLVVFNLLCR